MDYLPNSIEDGYEYAVTIVRKNVSDEKDRRDKKRETYSHSSYFKSSLCRIDNNTVAEISENYDHIEKLIDKRIRV